MRNWKTEKDLAAMLLVRASTRRRVVLAPETAHFVGLKLMTASEKPTRNEIALLLCTSKCSTPCYACTGKANVIANAYGSRVAD